MGTEFGTIGCVATPEPTSRLPPSWGSVSSGPSPINAPGQVSPPLGNLSHRAAPGAVLPVSLHLAVRTLSFHRLLPEVTQLGNDGMRLLSLVYGISGAVFFSSYHIAENHELVWASDLSCFHSSNIPSPQAYASHF